MSKINPELSSMAPSISFGEDAGFQVAINNGSITTELHPPSDSASRVQLDDVTTALKNYYTKGGQLKIQRLSGAELPVDHCHINLAVIERSRSSEATIDQHSSSFSLLGGRKVETIGQSSPVPLDTLFDLRKLNGKLRRPSRILIQGSAGVGKTTLCKKIVHDYFYRGLWQKLFDWLLWVPLQKLELKSSVKGYNLGNLLFDEYFSHYDGGENLAQAMWKTIGETTGDRTLFILDGLDEVSDKWRQGTPMYQLLRNLLEMPCVIIMTRPYRLSQTNLGRLDLELEIIGFLSNQVVTYVENPEIIREKETAKRIREFIQKNVLIRRLVRIPIQLDALCYSWEDFPKDMPQTMTAIYNAIVLKLWQKDILAFGKLLGERGVHDLPKIEKLIPREINLTEVLAFTGLYSDIVEFGAEVRKQIYNHQKLCEKLPEMPDLTLKKLSFLHTSDEILGDDVRSYRFLHLTFQEFFAARYFVRHWVKGQKLSCLHLRSSKMENVLKCPQKFLQEEKYNSRYNIFWRFVAGLLQDQNEEQRRFFKMLGDEPQDLLGPVHQRLLMHCFIEAPPKFHLEDLQVKMEAQLKQWAAFEHKLQGELKLCHEMEFPDYVLHMMMNEGSEDMKDIILQALEYRPHLSHHLLDQVASFLRCNISTKSKETAIHILGNQLTLSDNNLQALVTRLEDSDRHVRHSAIGVLSNQPTMSDSILQALVTRLEHSDGFVRQAAIDALHKQPTLSDNILQALVTRLEDSDGDVRESAIDALRNQPTLSDNILQALLTRLEDSNANVRRSAVCALGSQSTLSDSILQALETLLEDSDTRVRRASVNALGGQSTLSNGILQALVIRLEDSDGDVRESAIDALRNQTTLSDDILRALVIRLEDSQYVRESAIHALRKQPALSDNIIQALVTLLEHSDGYVRRFAVMALEQQPTLSDNILKALITRLGDSYWYTRESVLGALIQNPLSDNILQALVTQLEHSDGNVRWSAIYALRNQSTLSDSILQALVTRLEDSDQTVRWYAIDTLGKQPTLSDNILLALVTQTEDSDTHIKLSAINALGNQSTLPNNILRALVTRLEDSDGIVRKLAIDALGKQANLSDSISQALITRLEDSDEDVRWSAIDVLGKRVTLSDSILQALVTRLEDSYRYVRWSAVGVLGKQPLSDNILHALVTRLEDSDMHVRQASINALGNQSTLSDSILQALITRLEDSDGDVRWSAINVLGKQANLSDNILQDLVTRRGHSKDTFNISPDVVGVLLKQDNFYTGFLNFDVKALRALYKILIQKSFNEPLSCYRQDGNLYINMPDQQRKISLVLNKDVLGAFHEEALALGRPTSLADDLEFMLTP